MLFSCVPTRARLHPLPAAKLSTDEITSAAKCCRDSCVYLYKLQRGDLLQNTEENVGRNFTPVHSESKIFVGKFGGVSKPLFINPVRISFFHFRVKHKFRKAEIALLNGQLPQQPVLSARCGNNHRIRANSYADIFFKLYIDIHKVGLCSLRYRPVYGHIVSDILDS